MIDPGHSRLSIVRQCELASISRSSFYREPTVESEETLRLMRFIVSTGRGIWSLLGAQISPLGGGGDQPFG